MPPSTRVEYSQVETIGQTTNVASRQEQAREAVKVRILSGSLKPGTPLSEEVIAGELGMSRTPVRQAFQELISAGLLERVPGRGVMVARIDMGRLLEILEVQQCLLEWAASRLCQRDAPADLAPAMGALESQKRALSHGDFAALRVAARRMDVAIISATRNREMGRFMREISDLLLHGAAQALHSPMVYEDAVREHGEILQGLVDRDFGRVLGTIRDHFQGVHRRLRERRG